MTVPSQTPEAAGLEVVAWMMRQTNGVRSYACITPCDDSYIDEGWFTKEPLVTAASAQAAIDAEKAKVAELEERIAYLRGSRDGHAAHAHSEFEARVAAEARADRLAKALERAADDLRDIGTQKPQPTNSPDPEHENYLRRVLISLGQVGNARARAALQQETQP